jgi:branched-chain amino acid transport system ATP-binding protein
VGTQAGKEGIEQFSPVGSPHAQIMDTVSAVVRGGGVTAVVIEHDMDVVFRYSDRIVMMHEGAFLADGTPDEIRANKDVASILLGAPLPA